MYAIWPRQSQGSLAQRHSFRGRKQTVLLPVEAAAVWQRHLRRAGSRQVREKTRAERLARGEPYDYDLWDGDEA
ncbi:hypothetical protein OUY22_14095 [Nonomuraea sp. MCN248]|uniref:DUF3018 family protein n=1 Tax=Nonomuraea corallina TaxID=2989783 RepID=A0ABT4SBG9_9ACTN|nr:hypothetical protein [Nonomuraea corallina]MDA0634552.1 hypothetical protein [Nonomuraea corallina]